MNGWRSSQTIWRTQRCLCPHTFLRTQIRNILQEWYQNQGSTVTSLTSREDRNCEVCLRTKITRAPRIRRTGEAALRAEEFGDLTTADHKVLNEEGESRKHHRYAVVVQDLATQWMQSYPCKIKISRETEKNVTGQTQSHSTEHLANTSAKFRETKCDNIDNYTPNRRTISGSVTTGIRSGR